MVAVPLGLLRHLGREPLRRVAQVLHQLADLFVAGAALKRFAQSLLGGPQVALRLGGVAVLDLERHRPQELGDIEKIGVRACALERVPRLLEAEVDAGGVSNSSGATARPDKPASMRLGAWSGSRMRSRRSSTSARASGLWNGRCGKVTSTGALCPVLPETLVALSVIVTVAPAHGCSERSMVA